ncbi:hypothetical protein IS446_14975 [Robertkochia sp. 1368]|nr:hypothetical protein [Robertkochia sediminum]
MRNPIIIICLLITIFPSCNEVKEEKSKSLPKQTSIIDENLQENIGPRQEIETKNYRYNIRQNSLKNIDTLLIKQYAKTILSGESYPSDNDETISCIDLLFSENTSDLEFYFEVFRVIVEKADGSLAEIMGSEIISFMEFKTSFFLDKYSEFELKEKERFINLMSYEFYFSEPDPIEDIEIQFESFFSNLKENEGQKKEGLKRMKELTKEATKIRINE